MEDWFPVIRSLHVLSASFWIGEIAVINFILIPSLSKIQGESRNQLLINVFPKLFNLASILSSMTVVSGLLMVIYLTDGHFERLFGGRWGLSILIGGSLGILLTLFHFFVENRMAKKIGLRMNGTEVQPSDVHLKQKIIPRLGLLVILSVFLLMMHASRGIL